jgi:cysteine desulfurase
MKVYFDNAATTPLHPKVLEKMLPFLNEEYGNASSIHSFGRKARVAIEDAREVVANFINANPSEIYFTSGGTEANNFVLTGIAKAAFEDSGKNHIIIPKAEHHCILDTCEELRKSNFNLSFSNVTDTSQVTASSILSLLNSNTSLISVMNINNETGTVNPIAEISSKLKERNILFHTDAVQSFGKIKIDVKSLGIDALCASAHKINGPKGIGFAYVKSGTPISPIIFGGSQERNRRGGTENVAAIVGFAEAIKIVENNSLANEKHVNILRTKLLNGLLSISEDKIRINGGSNVSPYILSVTFKSEYYKNDSEAMLMYLDINGIAASNGAACTSGTLKPSHVIIAAGYSIEDANGTIRFSFGNQNTEDEVDYVIDVLNNFEKKFRK